MFPGVGYYKFHTTFANGFEDASSKCAKEGGHLAIVNSESEHQVLSTIFARFPEIKTDWAFVGFHDREKEGEYLTIFGHPLNTTGFTRWSAAGQPDNYKGVEDCGSVHFIVMVVSMTLGAVANCHFSVNMTFHGI
ncbi:hypothetical protein J437_LFUL017474, partial [Ladona fulva]